MATPHVFARRLTATLALALLLAAPAAALPQDADLLTFAAPTAAPSMEAYAGTYALPAGGRLEVEAEGNRLRIQGHGPQAVAALAAAPRPADAALAVYGDRTSALLDGWTRGDLTPLFAALPEHRRERATVDLTRLVHLFSDAYGTLDGYEVLGTLPGSNGRIFTYARLRFAGGTEVVRFVWRGEYLGSFNRNVFPAPTLAALPVAADRFVAVGRTADAPLWFTFDADAGTVTIQGAGEPVTAVRR